MATDISRLHARVHGKVQRVNYRYFTMQAARRIGLTGWVRNRLDRTVELVAEGTKVQLSELLNILHEGPTPANVSKIDTEWEEVTGEFSTFKIRMTR